MSELLPLSIADKCHYKERAYRLTHPDHLACIGILFGLRPESPTNCRVLELGCGAGTNLLPLAYSLPQSSFLGVDISEQLISTAEDRRTRLGLRNVEFRRSDIGLLDLANMQFDYIICHNVFSFLNPRAQERVMRICAQHLKPQGLAYINYATYPGWHLRETVRELLDLHLDTGSPAYRVEQARKFSLWFTSLLSQLLSPQSQLIRQELARLHSLEDWQIVFEYLGPNPQPVYFQELCERAQSAGLQYVSEAVLSQTYPGEFSGGVQQELLYATKNVVDYEQAMDFLRNTSQRRTIFCRRDQQVRRTLRPELLQHFFVSSQWRPEDHEDPETGAQVFVHTNGKRLAMAEPERVRALHILHEHWPEALPVSDFVDLLIRDNPAELDRPQLLSDLAQAFFSGLLNFHISPPPCGRVFPERPRTSAVARLEAASSFRVTNLRHEGVQLDAVEQKLLGLCDGSRTIQEVKAGLAAQVAPDICEQALKQLLVHALVHRTEAGAPSLVVH